MKIVQKEPIDPMDALASQAAIEEKAASADAGEQQPSSELAPKDLSNAQCLMMAFEVMRETLCSFAKVTSPKETMRNDVMQPVADAVAAVLDKYGVSLSGLAGDFMTEIKAAIVTVPVLLSIRAGLKAEVKAAKKPEEGPPTVDEIKLTDGESLD